MRVGYCLIALELLNNARIQELVQLMNIYKITIQGPYLKVQAEFSEYDYYTGDEDHLPQYTFWFDQNMVDGTIVRRKAERV